MKDVFVTGGTGYIGRSLLTALFEEGCRVFALVRPGSEGKLPSFAFPVIGNALDASTFAARIPPDATVIHLVGTPHPGPGKAAEFQRVDLASIMATTEAIRRSTVRHLVYISVAHPAPVMKEFIAAREEGERLVQASQVPATIFRPWYVLGRGHWWPYFLAPAYAVLHWFPSTRDMAERLGLDTLKTMVAALVEAVQDPPPSGVRIVEVPEIKRLASHHHHGHHGRFTEAHA
jgi:uncharacterized protein YbjT (DUF2867 family)